MNTQTRPEFATQEEAFDWMYAEVNDDCVDNERFAFEDDEEALRQYSDQERNGCCGSFDEDIIVNGRNATIGCNYGH